MVNFFSLLHLREKNMCEVLPESLVETISLLGRKDRRAVARGVHSLVSAPVRVNNQSHADPWGRSVKKAVIKFSYFFSFLSSRHEGQEIAKTLTLFFLSPFSLNSVSGQRESVYLCLSVQAIAEKKQEEHLSEEHLRKPNKEQKT